MKIKGYVIFLVFCFASCNKLNKNSNLFMNDFVTDCINIIGKDIPDTYSRETEFKYSKTIERGSQNNFEIYITLIANDDVVETCSVTIFGSDFLETKQYYEQLLNSFKIGKWEFISYISRYKQPYGELYFKDGIYIGIYEPSSFLSIPMCFSKDKSLNGFYFTINENQPEMIYSTEYYKNKIIEYRNFFDERQEVSIITKIDNIIPGFLSFLVCWDDNLKGYIYELYIFDKNQNIIQKYLVGYGPFINNYVDILMEKLPGNKIDHALISYGDFNHDGINEILSYSFYPNMGYVFTVFGYNVSENDFVHTCLVPIFINFEIPFSPVEYIGNGFRILEVIESESLELIWNNYVWDMNTMAYIIK
jgi:hypothetical protein